MRLIGYLFVAAGMALAIAAALLSLSEWQPFAAAPPLAGILGALAIAALVGFVMASGVRADFVNFAALLAFIALGRLLLAADQQVAHVVLALAHIGGLAFYARYSRPRLTISQHALGIALIFLPPLIVWFSTTQMLVTLYVSALGAMAAASWMSRFSRLLSGLGVLVYAGSDIVLLAGGGAAFMTPMLQEALGVALFVGLAATAIGVVRTFRRDTAG